MPGRPSPDLANAFHAYSTIPINAALPNAFQVLYNASMIANNAANAAAEKPTISPRIGTAELPVAVGDASELVWELVLDGPLVLGSDVGVELSSLVLVEFALVLTELLVVKPLALRMLDSIEKRLE